MLFCLLTGLILLAACVGNSNKPGQRNFPKVSLPVIATDQRSQAEFLAIHYWDNFDFADTSWVGSYESLTEQALFEYLSILPYSSYDVICKGISQLLDKADGNQAMYAFFYSKMEYYLSSPSSTLRNEELYIPVLEHIISSKSLDEQRKLRPKTLLPLLNKNRPSTTATNIHFTRPSGARDSLTNIKADYILVVFYDFECADCNVLKQLMSQSTVIKEMQTRKKLAILAIYPGANMEGWKKSLPQVPSSWINGYDHDEEIGRLGTYILQSIPTLYLLDRNYMVIMKEQQFNYVEAYLNTILNQQAQ
jgi:hypothetical protein